MSLPEAVPAKRRLPLAQLAVAAVVVLVLAAIALWVFGWQAVVGEARALLAAAMARVTSAGPAVFFTAMALLPALGAPNLAFALTAAPLFGEQLGSFWVCVLGLAAITVNLTLTYWLARRWLRPWLTRLLVRFGYTLPQVGPGDMTNLIVLLRVTPGVPFFVQNYTLGLVDAPFGKYLAISCGVQWAFNIAFILFGDALQHGRGKLALTAAMLFLALMVGTQWLRKKFAKREA
ncbi:MAG: hypothetical protein RLZZ15_2390 [Verrucomicrobiota bacterium]|jgi:uncharacterized membrane protein YdjX (TVP38/TMEM64 family)